MTREDVKKVVDVLKSRDVGFIDLGIPVYTSVIKETGMKDISLNLRTRSAVIEIICGELDIE